MGVLTKEQLLKNIQSVIGENTSDEAIKLIEDVSDTISDYETKTKDTTDWEAKYTENDNAWRKKYRDRFFSTEEIPEENNSVAEPEPQNLKYENLFKEEKK